MCHNRRPWKRSGLEEAIIEEEVLSLFELLIDAGLFLDTDYVMPEGWWAIVGICGGIVVSLIVFAAVLLGYAVPRIRRAAKEASAGTAGVSAGEAVSETDISMNESQSCVMKDDSGENMDGTPEGCGASGEYEEKQGDCKEMAEVDINETAEEADDERLDRSFTARLILADEDVKGWYSLIKNAALSYKGTKASMAWKQEKLRCGRKQIGKLLIRGKVLCLYLNLTMDDLKDSKVNYRVEDMSKRAINSTTPLMYRIKNPLRARHAVELIDMVAAKLGLTKAKRFQPVDYVAELAPKTEEELMDCGLIRTAPQTQYDTFTPGKE